MHKTNPLDLLGGKGFNLLLGVANQPKPSNATAIAEGDVLTSRIQLPTRLFVLNAPVIVLKPGIPLFPWLVRFAVLIETGNSEPGPISTGLTRLGVETVGKGVLFGKQSTIALEIILGGVLIHPETEALVADELNHANGFINSGVLSLGTVHLVFVDEHPLALSSLLCYTKYTSIASIRQEEITHETNKCVSVRKAIRAASNTCGTRGSS